MPNETAPAKPREQASCRGCHRKLRGDAYMYGREAYLPEGGRAKVNHYGGFVCSRACDYRASVEMHASMPGCGGATKPDGSAMARIKRNWDND